MIAPLVRLGEVADVNWGDTSVTKSSYVDEGYVAYSATGPDGYLPYADYDRPAIVLSAIGARCGKTWFAEGKWSCIKNTIRFWSTDQRLDNRYLYWVTNREDFFPKRGAAQPFITIGDARSAKIRMPPLDEQRRIAAILDKADALRRKRKRAIELIDRITQSIFFELFGHTSEEVLQWGNPVALADLADIGSGITKGRKLNGHKTREVPYMAVVNVQDRRLDLSSVKTIEASEEEISRYRLADGDLLLTEGGDPDKLGRGTLWAGELPEAIHQNHIFRVRVRSDSLLPLFLNWLVSSPYGKRYFLNVAKQTTGIASINKTQLSQFPTIVPPIEVQQRFVDVANAVAAETKHLHSSSNNIDFLFSSLQHRAFSGQL